MLRSAHLSYLAGCAKNHVTSTGGCVHGLRVCAPNAASTMPAGPWPSVIFLPPQSCAREKLHGSQLGLFFVPSAPQPALSQTRAKQRAWHSKYNYSMWMAAHVVLQSPV
jgi:hypothetical protein